MRDSEEQAIKRQTAALAVERQLALYVERRTELTEELDRQQRIMAGGGEPHEVGRASREAAAIRAKLGLYEGEIGLLYAQLNRLRGDDVQVQDQGALPPSDD